LPPLDGLQVGCPLGMPGYGETARDAGSGDPAFPLEIARNRDLSEIPIPKADYQ